MKPTPGAIAECIGVLEALLEHPESLAAVDLETRNRLVMAAGRVSHPNRAERKRLSRAVNKEEKLARRAEDETQLRAAGIRVKRLAPVFVTPDPLALAGAEGGTFEAHASPDEKKEARGHAERAPPLNTPRACYVCKAPCERVHFFYDQMCGACGDFNYAKRSQSADLRGRVAFISGARVKIGYQAAILLLRAGARVIVSTRFPRDAALRYAREVDYADWKHRLQIYGLDLRHTPSVETFARHLQRSLGGLDFVVHNACQTVRRPSGFYRHLMLSELGPLSSLPEAARPLLSDYEGMRAAPTELAVRKIALVTVWEAEMLADPGDTVELVLGQVL